MRQKSLNPAFIVLQSRLEMCWNCQQRFLSRPVFAAILQVNIFTLDFVDREKNLNSTKTNLLKLPKQNLIYNDN